MRNYLGWRKLDSMKSSIEIADALRKYGIRGKRKSATNCPLARAASRSRKYEVGPYARRTSSSNRIILSPLTQAEMAFIREFDGGSYPDLIMEEEAI